jgi:hypothetical protein
MKRRAQKQVDLQKHEEENDRQETDIAREVMLRTETARKEWERQYGSVTETSLPNSGRSSEKKASSTEVIELVDRPGNITRSPAYASSTTAPRENTTEHVVTNYTPVTVIAKDVEEVKDIPSIFEPAPLPPPATSLPVPLLTPQPRGLYSGGSLSAPERASAASSLRHSGEQFYSAGSDADDRPVSSFLSTADARSSTVDPVMDDLSERSISGPLSSFSDLSAPEHSIGEALAEPQATGLVRSTSPEAMPSSVISPSTSYEMAKDGLGPILESPLEQGLTTIPEGSEGARSSIVEPNPKRLTRESLAERSSQDLTFIKKHHMFEWTKRASEADEPLNLDVDWPQVPGRPASPPTVIEANLSSPLITGESKPAEAAKRVSKEVKFTTDKDSLPKSKESSKAASSSGPPSVASSGTSSSSYKGVDPHRLHSGVGSRRQSLTSVAQGSDGENDALAPRPGNLKTVGVPDFGKTLLGQREHMVTTRKTQLSSINTERARMSTTNVSGLKSQTASPIAEDDSDDEIPLARRREILLARQSSSSSTLPRPLARTTSDSSQIRQPRPEPHRQSSGPAGRPGVVDRANELDPNRQSRRLSQTIEQRVSMAQSQSPPPLSRRTSQQNMLGNASRHSAVYGNQQRESQQNVLQNFDSHQPNRDRSQRQSQQAQLYAQWQNQVQPQRQLEVTSNFEAEMNQRRQQMIHEKRERELAANQSSQIREQMEYYRQNAMRTATGAIHHNVAMSRLQQQVSGKPGESKRKSSGNQ